MSKEELIQRLTSGHGFECVVDIGSVELGCYVQNVEWCEYDDSVLDVAMAESEAEGKTFRMYTNDIRRVKHITEDEYEVEIGDNILKIILPD